MNVNLTEDEVQMIGEHRMKIPKSHTALFAVALALMVVAFSLLSMKRIEIIAWCMAGIGACIVPVMLFKERKMFTRAGEDFLVEQRKNESRFI